MFALDLIRQRLRVCHNLEKDYHLKSKSHQQRGNEWTSGFCFGVATALGLERFRLGRLYRAIRKETDREQVAR